MTVARGEKTIRVELFANLKPQFRRSLRKPVIVREVMCAEPGNARTFDIALLVVDEPRASRLHAEPRQQLEIDGRVRLLHAELIGAIAILAEQRGGFREKSGQDFLRATGRYW